MKKISLINTLKKTFKKKTSNKKKSKTDAKPKKPPIAKPKKVKGS